MNSRLQEERVKALELLNSAQQPKRVFNLSDLKSDKTQYFDSSPQCSRQQQSQSPFEPSEISARSTTFNRRDIPKVTYNDMDFDDIMKSSNSADVRNKYRESIGMGRLSSCLRTADMSLRTTLSGTNQREPDDFWDNSKVAANSFNGNNFSVRSDEFRPAEEMAEKFDNDEMEQEQEFAAIPMKTSSNETNWDDRSSIRQPEMSFGAYAQGHILGSNDIKQVYGNRSPVKRSNREPLVEMNDEISTESNNLATKNLQMLIQSCDTPQAQNMIQNHGKKVKKIQEKESNQPSTSRQDMMSGISDMFNSLNFDKIMELAMKDKSRQNKENSLDDPVRDDTLIRHNTLQPPRETKRRRSNSLSSDTPKSALDKCMRSKSPAKLLEQKEIAATLLKPKIPESRFIVPDSSSIISTTKHSSKQNATYSREYYTAQSLSMTGEKLSLPNYGLIRPENTFSSPTSNRSSSRMSPDGILKRTVSQLSNGSEFHDDVLPLKIKKAHRKLSWQSVKLYQDSIRTVTIQNGSNKKLPLHVRIQGSGFSVSPREDFRMIPQEARTFEVKFSPTVLGAVRGELIFELATNSKFFLSIPLFAYGGHTSLRLDNVQKGPVGPSFITMGQMNFLYSMLEQTLKLTNHGTLPGFALLAFEKTKWSDFSLSDSVDVTPSEVRIMPGESVNVRIRFKATKEEIRKILNLNKEVTIVGELCIISGDEPTRVRLFKNKDCAPQQFFKYLPPTLPDEGEFKKELILFNENLDRGKFSAIVETIRTHEVALTINRNMDETQMIAAELSMADESMSFMTFCDNNYTKDEAETDDTVKEDVGYLESEHFIVSPAQIIFNRQDYDSGIPKSITVESKSESQLFIEAVPSTCEFISATKNVGILKPRGIVDIKVFAKPNAFKQELRKTVSVWIHIGNARMRIPVEFIN